MLTMRRREVRVQPDYVFISLVAALVIVGLIALSSASVAVGLENFGDPYFFIKKQLILGLLPGLAFGCLLSRLPYARWQAAAVWLFALSVILLLLVLIPGVGSGYSTGARSWFAWRGYSFQPAEAAKLAVIIFLSSWLARHRESIREFKHGFLAALGLGCIPVLLALLQPDVGTASILFAAVFSLLFFAGARFRHLALLLIIGLAAFAFMVIIAPYRLNRLTTFLHPELDPQGIGYHINQAYLAIGSGGWFGLGLGHSRQKFQYLPEVHADSIFAVMSEELGFVLASAIIILIILILWRGLKIAARAPDDFGRLLVCGIVAWFSAQTLLNIGAMVGLLPLTGVPLPFVSHGGSALMVSLIAVGIIASVSRSARGR